MDKISFGTIGIVGALVGAIISVFLFAVDMKQSQEKGFERINNRLTLYFQQDEKLNEDWLAFDKEEHSNMLKALQTIDLEMGTLKGMVKAIDEEVKRFDKGTELKLLDLRNSIGDVRAECAKRQ